MTRATDDDLARADEILETVRAARAAETKRIDDLKYAATQLDDLYERYREIPYRRHGKIATRARIARDAITEILELMEGSR